MKCVIICILVISFIISCKTPTNGRFEGFRDKYEIENKIKQIQDNVGLAFKAQPLRNGDSTLITMISINETIPDDSLSDAKAKSVALVVYNHLMNRTPYTNLRVVFSKKKKQAYSKSLHEIEYNYLFDR